MNTTVKTPPRKPGRPSQGRPPESRQARQAGPARLGRPVRPLRPARPPRPAGPATAPARSRATGAARDLHAAPNRPTSRTPFILLLLGLLGGGLVCLLIVNTTLSTAQFNITKLQQQNEQLSQQQQTLQQQIATDEAPGTIEKRAFQLGMREQKRLTFLDVRNGRIYRQPSRVAGEPSVVPPPGFTP